jgi:hypothetical protein
MLLSVEKQDNPAVMSFLVPLRPRPGASASQITDSFARLVSQSQPQLKVQPSGQSSQDRATAQFTSVVSGTAVEGRICTLVAAGGSMAFILGVQAPQGQLQSEMPTLQQVARSMVFTPPRAQWTNYRSPGGGFTMLLPQGWQVQSGDGQSPKDNIDWGAMDPAKPLSRAFQWCPRYCSPQLLQDPMHAMRGYQAGQFQNHQEVIVASLGQISQNVKLIKMNVNEPLTTLFRGMNQQVAQFLAGINAAQMDIVVYDCLAEADVDGQRVVVAFIGGIQSMMINAGIMGQLMDLSVTLRGWCAAPDQFINDSPVLEKVCLSMQPTAAFVNRIVQGNAQASGVIRDTYAKMNEMDNQIRDTHWKTMDAIAEMNYDTLRQYGGYVNENSGRIEQIDPDKVVKNSSGEVVSREEVERGVDPNQATVLRDAYSNDYMKGVYGRVEFP